MDHSPLSQEWPDNDKCAAIPQSICVSDVLVVMLVGEAFKYGQRAKPGHSLSFCTDHGLRIIFTVFKELETNQKKNIIWGHMKVI